MRDMVGSEEPLRGQAKAKDESLANQRTRDFPPRYVEGTSYCNSIPGVGGGGGDDDEGESKEEQMEQERLRQEAIKQAERERRDKYKKQEDEREVMRQSIRDKRPKPWQSNN
eukprot:snap_masked-scaffold993_size72668-processed-gene-0.5 protein:Tk11422 transcript:snap_masked-scaffold993_size72668-processed-gene-0.5-mRNA-1 annotation:"complexin"